jgi:lysophospholipase L1-like esterase
MRHPVLRDGGYGGTYVYPTQNTALSGARNGSICAADWVTDAPKFELIFVGNRSNVQIYVDGKCVTPAPINLAIDFGVGYRVLVDFTQGGTLTTGVRKQRKIRMEMRANGSYALFGGITLLKSDSITPPSSANSVRGVVFGDSFIEGKDPLHPLAQISCPNDGFANRIGDLLGWDECIVCGVGGTGYLSDTTGTAKKYGDRINDITSLNPDVVVVFGSLNDGPPYTPANTQAAVTAFHTQLAAALPNAVIVVLGVQKVGNSSDTLASLNTAVAAGVAAVGAPNITFVDMFNPAWVTGTGKSTAQTNDGNADWVTGSDGVHPTWEGHNFYTYKIAEAIRNIISSQLKRN